MARRDCVLSFSLPLSLQLKLSLSIISEYVSLHICPLVCPPTYLTVCAVCLSTCLCVCLTVYPVYLSACLCGCLSISIDRLYASVCSSLSTSRYLNQWVYLPFPPPLTLILLCMSNWRNEIHSCSVPSNTHNFTSLILLSSNFFWSLLFSYFLFLWCRLLLYSSCLVSLPCSILR